MYEFDPRKPFNNLPFMPPEPEEYESIELWKWKHESAARSALAELKGFANIITTKGKLYQAMSASKVVDSDFADRRADDSRHSLLPELDIRRNTHDGKPSPIGATPEATEDAGPDAGAGSAFG
jgi:hypothetical protein